MTGTPQQITFGEMIRDAASQADTVLLGDTNHLLGYEMALDKMNGSLVDIAESGVTHIYLEFDVKMQEQFTALAEGRIGRDEFARNCTDILAQGNPDYDRTHAETLMREKIAPLIENGEKMGITVHAADFRHGDEYNTQIHDLETRIETMREAEKGNAAPSDELLSLQRELLDLQDTKAHARLDDRDLAGLVHDTARGEKSIVLFGADHLQRDGDFENALGAGSLVRINLQPTENSARVDQAIIDAQTDPARSTPDYNYRMDTQTLQSTTADTAPADPLPPKAEDLGPGQGTPAPWPFRI